jgi:uridine monophosphate synthetase
MIEELQRVGVIKVAEKGKFFKLKSGQQSQVYADFRSLLSHPKLFAQLCYQLSKLVERKDIAVCGVPLGAIPYAQMVAHILQVPSIIVRPAAKEYGLKNTIEGGNLGQDIVIVEDVFTTGQSISETVLKLQAQGRKVCQIVTILDRRVPDQVGQHLNGIPVNSLFSLSDFEPNQRERRKIKVGQLTRILMEIQKKKRTNLVVAVDLADPVAVLKVCKEVGPYVCAIKLHLDLVDFTKMSRVTFVRQLVALKQELTFLILEDRKFADIGQIAGMQLDLLLVEYDHGLIDMVTVHAICGRPALVEMDKRNIGLVVVQQLSCDQNLIDPLYSAKANDMLDDGLKNVVGVVAQNLNPRWLTFGPGISLETKSDNAGQVYKPPSSSNADIFIVGRAISHNPSPATAAQKYQQHCFNPFISAKL